VPLRHWAHLWVAGGWHRGVEPLQKAVCNLRLPHAAHLVRWWRNVVFCPNPSHAVPACSDRPERPRVRTEGGTPHTETRPQSATGLNTERDGGPGGLLAPQSLSADLAAANRKCRRTQSIRASSTRRGTPVAMEQPKPERGMVKGEPDGTKYPPGAASRSAPLS
jgi:hypothetical protein